MTQFHLCFELSRSPEKDQDSKGKTEIQIKTVKMLSRDTVSRRDNVYCLSSLPITAVNVVQCVSAAEQFVAGVKRQASANVLLTPFANRELTD